MKRRHGGSEVAMRVIGILLLGAAGLVAAVDPASADHRMGRRDVLPSFAVSNGLASLELHPTVVRPGRLGERSSERRRRDLGVLIDDWPGLFDGSGYGYGSGYGISAPPVVVIDREPPPAPPRPAAEARPSVETTPSGVQIVRGPGSRHVAP
jgi:hypothetical protein